MPAIENRLDPFMNRQGGNANTPQAKSIETIKMETLYELAMQAKNKTRYTRKS